MFRWILVVAPFLVWVPSGCEHGAAPTTSAPDAGAADAGLTDAGRAADATADASGAAACRADEPRLALVASPDKLGFGRSLSPSCAPAAQDFFVRNDGTSPVAIHELLASSALSLAPATTLPTTLEAGAALSLTATFTPTVLGSTPGIVLLRGPTGCVELPWFGVGLDDTISFGWSSALALDFGTLADGEIRTKEMRFLDVERTEADQEILSAVTSAGFEIEAAPSMPFLAASCTEFSIRITMRGDRTTPTLSGRLQIESRAAGNLGIREFPLYGRTAP